MAMFPLHRTRAEISAPEGSYRPAKRDLIPEIWSDREPKSVTEQIGPVATVAESLPRLSAAELATVPRGWSFCRWRRDPQRRGSF